MIRRIFNLYSFAMLKANKVRPEASLSIEQINRCRQLLKVGKAKSTSLEENSLSYLKQRSKTFIKSDSDEILRRWEEVRPIQCEVNILSFSRTYTSNQRQYVDSLIKFWGSFFQANKHKFQQSQSESYKRALLDFTEAFNSLVYLMTLNSANVFTYLTIYMLVRELKLIKDKHFSSLRYVFDALLALPEVQGRQLEFLLFFTSRYTPHIVYFTREAEIWNFIYKQIPQNWTTHPSEKLQANIIYSLTINSSPPNHLVQKLPELLQTTKSNMLKYRTFAFMVESFQITKQNVRNKQFLEPLKQIISQIPEKSMRSLAKMFYRADIWLPQFWEPYFNYMSRNNNYQQIDNVDHHIIDDLLANGEGGEPLRQEALKFRQFLKAKGLDVSAINCREEYERIFGRLANDKSVCQHNIANKLRLICRAEVVTEVAVKYFLVDIVVGKKIAIEINSANHYKYIDGQPVLNLKSQFRQRVLSKQGYVCKNIHVEDFAFSNYNMLQDIYHIVQESTELNSKIAEPRFDA